MVTNHPEHDPDIQHIPFFAISKDFFGSLWSTYYKRIMALDAFSKVMIPLQHRIYYVVLSLARFNLYANSYAYLFGPKPKHDNFWRFELAGVAFYWTYFGLMLRSLPSWKMRIGYLLISHMVSSPVHVQVNRDHVLQIRADDRSFYLTLHAQLKTLDQRNLSLRGNYVPPWTSSAHLKSNSFTVDYTSK